MQLSHAALVLLIFSSLLHLLVAAEQPRPLFMWGGDAGEEHLVSWRNSSGNRREISMTVLSSKQPTALHVHRIFDDAECDLLVHLAKQSGLFDSAVQKPGPNMWTEEFITASFLSMDIDYDGLLDAQELQDGLARIDSATRETIEIAEPDKNRDGFISLDEALHMDIQAAHLKRDDSRTGDSRVAKVRNSRQTWLPQQSHWYNEAITEFIDSVYERMAAAMQLPPEYVKNNSEALQVVHYRPFEHYHAHTDSRARLTRASQDPTWLINAHNDLALLDAIVFEAEVLYPCCHQLHDRHAFIRQALDKVFTPGEMNRLPELLSSQDCASTSRCSMLQAMADYLRAAQDPSIQTNIDVFECSTCRYATLLVFLNDVVEGGHTSFPLANNATLKADPSMIPRETHHYSNLTETQCKPGMSVKPSKGDAVLWYNYVHEKSTRSRVLSGSFGVPDTVDEFSLHGGCDVLQGEKWAINLWLHALPKLEESMSGLDLYSPN